VRIPNVRPGKDFECDCRVLKIELHAHTSDDPCDDIPHSTGELIDRAADLGYDGVAITLHDRQLDLRPFASHARERGITIIPGIERTIEGRHVLLLNFSAATETVHNFDDVRRLKSWEPSGLVVAPHPFFPVGTSLRDFMDQHASVFDAVEYNAMFTSVVNFNWAAERWAKRNGKPMVGNGDVHRLRQLGSTWSLVDAAPTADAICDAIRRGRVKVVSQPLSALAAAAIMSDLVMSDLRRGRPGQILPRSS
jgi:predicted metal-dependent phosphoesterase TrpH